MNIKLALSLLSAYSPRNTVKRNHERVKAIYEKNAFSRTWFIKKKQKFFSVVCISVHFSQDTRRSRCPSTSDLSLTHPRRPAAPQKNLAQLQGGIHLNTLSSGFVHWGWGGRNPVRNIWWFVLSQPSRLLGEIPSQTESPRQNSCNCHCHLHKMTNWAGTPPLILV